MNVIEYLMNLDTRLIIAYLVIIVLLVQGILFFFLRRRLKKGILKLENELEHIKKLINKEESEEKESSGLEDVTVYPIKKKEEKEVKAGSVGKTPADNALNTCLIIYNAALTNREDRGRFFDQYRYIPVDVINAVERRRNPRLEPVFQSADNGDYYVVKLHIKGRNSFAVLPRFGLIIRESNYKDGALGEVFDCPGFNERAFYRIGQVILPAYFAKESDEKWELISKGRLELIPD